jgi:hypothetical protein
VTTATGKPEDLLHRVAREEGFWGRYNLSDAEDGLRELLTDIRAEMNKAFGIQRLSLRANGHHSDLYFDIIEADEDEANAMAFVEGCWAMVGVTQGLFTSMSTLLASACQDSDFVQSFGVNLHLPSPSGLFVLLYLTTFNFVSNHELGHLVHGHCGSISGARSVRKEFAKRAKGGPQLDVQAGEVEADGYGTHLTLQTLLASPAREHAAGLLNAPVDHPGLDHALLEVFLTAAVCFFHRLHEPFDAALVDERSHPVELSRINTVITDMQGWCEEHHPRLASWPTKQQFSDLGGLIRHALRNSGIADTWDAQNRFLDSDPGRDYRKRLYQQREILREQMRPFKWEILKSPQGQHDSAGGKTAPPSA